MTISNEGVNNTVNIDVNVLIEEIRPLLDQLWDQLPEKHREIAKLSFENILEQLKVYTIYKLSNDEAKIKSTGDSINHAITALLSTIISGISRLEDSDKQIAGAIALRLMSFIFTKLLSFSN